MLSVAPGRSTFPARVSITARHAETPLSAGTVANCAAVASAAGKPPRFEVLRAKPESAWLFSPPGHCAVRNEHRAKALPETLVAFNACFTASPGRAGRVPVGSCPCDAASCHRRGTELSERSGRGRMPRASIRLRNSPRAPIPESSGAAQLASLRPQRASASVAVVPALLEFAISGSPSAPIWIPAAFMPDSSADGVPRLAKDC